MAAKLAQDDSESPLTQRKNRRPYLFANRALKKNHGFLRCDQGVLPLSQGAMSVREIGQTDDQLGANLLRSGVEEPLSKPCSLLVIRKRLSPILQAAEPVAQITKRFRQLQELLAIWVHGQRAFQKGEILAGGSLRDLQYVDRLLNLPLIAALHQPLGDSRTDPISDQNSQNQADRASCLHGDFERDLSEILHASFQRARQPLSSLRLPQSQAAEGREGRAAAYGAHCYRQLPRL